MTATVDSMPLIASSIMGKKLAADDDCIVLDVKTGSGSFMKSIEDSKKLASIMVDIGKRSGKKMTALITDMDRPLGNAIGNSLEVIEAIETLKGNGPKDLYDLSIALSANMLYLAGKGEYSRCEEMAKMSISDGTAFAKLTEMVKAQGGNGDYIVNTDNFKKAGYTYSVLSENAGYIQSVNAEAYGLASLNLGAGRSKIEDKIDYTAGIILKKKTGDFVQKGEEIATLYANDKKLFERSKEIILNATKTGEEKPQPRPLIFATIR